MSGHGFRVLVVGGAGVFGSRLVDAMLASTAWQIVIAGRDATRTDAFLAARHGSAARLSARRLDARTCTPAELRATGADAVVDAAGPFQDASYGLALAAAAAQMHYVDLADSRAFVAGFADAVDVAARRGGTVALTGASSTPALSNAALDAITAGWRQVDDVTVAICPGNRAPRGLSVVRAILSYAGRPVRVFVDGQWAERPGWGMTRRVAVPGLGRRWASLCETPDLDIFPLRHRVRGTALFLAGLELGVMHLGLLLASLAVRWHLARSLAPMARPVRGIAALLAPFGSDRGGMLVQADGIDRDGQQMRARWCLVAVQGAGPVVPTLPALAALRAIAAGGLRDPGARACVGLLPLAAIEAECTDRGLSTTRTVVARPPDLFPAAAGSAFALLPAAVAALHRPSSFSAWAGMAEVERGGGLLARLVAGVFRFPVAGTGIPVRVLLRRRDDGESWTRIFGDRAFRSRLSLGSAPGEIDEKFGPFSFRLGVIADPTGLRLRVLGWRLGRLPLPRTLAIASDAAESMDEAGRFRFDVPIDLPLRLGRVVHYRGWLTPEG